MMESVLVVSEWSVEVQQIANGKSFFPILISGRFVKRFMPFKRFFRLMLVPRKGKRKLKCTVLTAYI